MSFVLHLLWSAGCLAGRKILNIMSNEELILHEIRQIKNDMHRMENVLEKIVDTQKDGWKEGRPMIINQYYLLDPNTSSQHNLALMIKQDSTDLIGEDQKNICTTLVSQNHSRSDPDLTYPSVITRSED